MADPLTIGPALAPSEGRGGPWGRAIVAAEAHAPYLRRLMARRPDLMDGADATDWPERMMAAAMEQAQALARDDHDLEAGMIALRRAKDGAHLALAMLDLSRAAPLHAITAALSAFADAAAEASLALAARTLIARGDLRADAFEDGALKGVTLIAMGKMGAHELNYSSDIDVSCFYDPAELRVGERREAGVVAVRLIAPFVRALEEKTADGYVFRTDLRLRPDPGATPAAVSIRSAENYYQHLGQNWERAAFIKARVAGGDRALGEDFLRSLVPFVWRKHLDYAAVADVESIKRQILTTHGGAALDTPIFDVKLGRGGIRDIELFVQTQQLILGGRNPRLRARGTVAALEALCEAKAIGAETRDALIEAYCFYRDVEHRVQMMEDAHAHDVPADPQARTRLAALCGFSELGVFEDALLRRRRIVSEIDRGLFGRGESLADPLGALSFTGVEDNPETLKTLASLGFAQPATVSQTIRGWHHGRIRAMRAERARELLTALTPKLLRALAQSGEPDIAFARFSAFFAGLNAGVQVLSLLAAEPRLLNQLASAFGLAPQLAEALARRPALIDSMIEPRFSEPIDTDAPGARAAELAERIGAAGGFEGALNAARRFHRDEAFRIGMQVLDGKADARAAGAAYADLAEACVSRLADAAQEEMERRFGAAPGAYCVLALGKFGGRELSQGSDLDLMIVYDAPAEAVNESGLSAADFYTRFTQRLVAALSAPTEEGLLYEVDMQLRPSGSSGPVAVRLSAFARYYGEDAWTWELLALTRARPVAGDAALRARVADIAGSTLSRARDGATVLKDVRAMRALMEKERPSAGVWDLKLDRGGFVDIEFIVQTLQILALRADALAANTGAALDRLEAAGLLNQTHAAALRSAWTLLGALQQLLRISAPDGFDPARASQSLKGRVAAALGVPDFAAAEAALVRAKAEAGAVYRALIGLDDDGAGAAAR